MKNDIAAVVVTYNRKELLCNCINALLAQSVTCDILVIDNGSTDGTQNAMLDFADKEGIFYVNTHENLGGAGGFNYGLKEAIRRKYTYIWLMDDDTYPDKDALERLLDADYLLKGKYGFLSSVAYWKDGTVCNMNRQKTTLRKTMDVYDEPLVPVIMATFVSFFIQSATVREVGYPISDFFIWSDDFEYSRRISRKYPGYAVTDSKVIHDMVSNQKVGIEHENDDRLWRYQYLYRNEVYLYKREGPGGVLFLLLRIVLHLFRVIIRGKDQKMKKIKVILTSFFNGFSFDPKIEYVKEEEQ